MPKVHIDGVTYDVKPGRNVLHTALSLGLDLPYFCWHPALGSVGACRLCAVRQFKDEDDHSGKIVMACMTPAEDGTRVSIEDEEAREFRASVLEWLMVNHPHDCPICDEGGECHLQDMTVMTGHAYRRSRFAKRTYRNQDLGPLVNHEMNRCIQCYRCVRFYRDYAGGEDLDVFGAHDGVYFGRVEDGTLESEFAGNLVEVCPTGVFTDKRLKEHYTRKWDLQTAPSVCVHCGVGCNTIPGERYGSLRRVRNRYNGEVNGYFLCDRGRYGYEFVNGERRVRQPRVAGRPTSEQEVMAHVRSALDGAQSVVGIGSPRASLEANFALRRLVGPERFRSGLSRRESRLARLALDILRNGPARVASVAEAACCDAVLVLGEDVPDTAPRLALALRQAARRQPAKDAAAVNVAEWNDAAVREIVQGRHGPFYVATPQPTALDELATKSFRLAPDDVARLGFDVARGEGEIAQALASAEAPLVVTGLGCGSEAVLEAAADAAWSLGERARLCVAVPECNTLGVAMLAQDESAASAEGADGAEAAESEGRVDGRLTIVLENDLTRRGLHADRVVAIDHSRHATVEQAEAVLPAATFAESCGTFVNYEGRAQRFYEVFVPPAPVRESWRWLAELAGERWQSLDDVVAALAEELPAFEPVTDVAPPADFRLVGQRVPRQPYRCSGRTSMHADVDVHEQPPPRDPDSALAYSMEGFGGIPPAPLTARFWAPGWNSVQALNKFQQEVAGPLRGGDPGKRLIARCERPHPAFDADIAPFEPHHGRWLFVPLHHVFGSEESSARAPGVAALTPAPYVAMRAQDAPGDEVEVTVGTMTQRLPVRRMDLPEGVAALPAGLPGMPWVDLPAWGEIRRV